MPLCLFIRGRVFKLESLRFQMFISFRRHVLMQIFFFKLNITKSCCRSSLTDENLSLPFRIATLLFLLNIQHFVKQKSSQKSHLRSQPYQSKKCFGAIQFCLNFIEAFPNHDLLVLQEYEKNFFPNLDEDQKKVTM